MAEWIITIDGPAGSGKSTMARLLAERLDACFLDTGAMYRTVTWAAMQSGVDLKNTPAVLHILDHSDFRFETVSGRMVACVNGADVTEAIRAPAVTAQVHHIADQPQVRTRLVQMQQTFADKHARIVTEGRDQGTVVFPDARVKLFLTADPAERARRRQEEMAVKGIPTDLEGLQRSIDQRDFGDQNRDVGALKPAPDAIKVDTTGFSVEQSIEYLVTLVQQQL